MSEVVSKKVVPKKGVVKHFRNRFEVSVKELDDLHESLTEGLTAIPYPRKIAVFLSEDSAKRPPETRSLLYNKDGEPVPFGILVAPHSHDVNDLFEAMKIEHPEYDLIFVTYEGDAFIGMIVVHPEKVKGVEVFVFTDLVEYYHWSSD